MNRLRVLIALTLLCGAALAQDEPLPGAPEFAGALAQYAAHVFTDAQHRAAADTINRDVREAQNMGKRATTDPERQAASAKRAEAVSALQALLDTSGAAITVDLRAEQTTLPPASRGAIATEDAVFLFRVNGGDGAPRAIAVEYNFSEKSTYRVPVHVAPDCPTWVLLTLLNVPTPATNVAIEFSHGGGNTTILPMVLTTAARGTLSMTVLSDDSGKPVPSMVRLVRTLDGQMFGPSNAIDFGPQLDHQGNFSAQRRTNHPGKLAGSFWICPGPFTMELAAGSYSVIVERGAEHVAVFDDFEVSPGTVTEKKYRPKRWIDMRDGGWWSGDDHVHCQIMSDDDAENLMTWAMAEDVHLCNIVKMGDINRTWFDQRGFGQSFRVQRDDYVLSPGQECPRTHNELGHTIHMNIKSMIRDTDQYYLYDTVFDAVQAQGGLSGYCHVNSGIFFVHRDMTMNIPKDKVDFVELLQFANLGTDIYYDFLNTGFEVTASAGSDVPWGGSIGEVRLYAYLGKKKFTPDAWFDAVEKGNTFVTNGIMLEFTVDGAIPGETVRITKDTTKPLRVQARAMGDPGRAVPTKLDVIVLGDVYKSAASSNERQETLEVDFKMPADHGFWIAARAEGSDGSRAHTSPIYVVRDGLRFWKFDAAPQLIEKRMASLAEVEQIVSDAAQRNATAAVEDNRPIKELAEQGPALLERVNAAKAYYAELQRVYEAEKALRAP